MFIRDIREKAYEDKVSFFNLFWLFMIGSVAGFLIEGFWDIVKSGVWRNHSATVWGPFCIVYGLGTVAVYLCCLVVREKRRFLQFLVFAVSGTVIEYFSSLFQEMVFHSTSWDYSNRFLNIGGRVSLQMSAVWGLLGVAFARILMPPILRLMDKIQTKPWHVAGAVLSIFMALNLLVTSAAVLRWHTRLCGGEEETPGGAGMQDRFQERVVEYLDENYDDDTMRKIFPNMNFGDLPEAQEG